MFDNAFAQILPAGACFRINGSRGGRENVSGTEVRTEFFGDDGPPHEFGYGEEFEELGLWGNESVAGISMDAVEEVGLLVVVRRKNDIVNYSLENLGGDVKVGFKGWCGAAYCV